jgi:mono/diheme cytochrome c family protein
VRKGSLLAAQLLAVVSGLALLGCQQKMATQPYFQPLEKNEFFKDGRASRPLEPGTVSRGDLREDDALYTGKVNGQLVTEFPLSVTEEVMARGHDRFNIYCAPCHSKLGDGNGMIVQRGVSRPPSFMDDRLVTAPVGHIYDVITNGYGRMYSYNQQIPVRDRWAIVAYVKALQAAGRGTIADVPPAVQTSLMQTSATTAQAQFPSNMMNEASATKAVPAEGKL